MDSIEERQQYLRVQILEAGYDPNDFIEHMANYSPIQSPSIETLTMSQLRKIVQSYKQEVIHRGQNSQQKPTEPKQKQQLKPISIVRVPEGLKQLEEKKTKIQYEKHGIFDFEFKGVMNCIESDRLVDQKQIQVQITQLETKQTEGFLFGIGSKMQYFYHIKSNLMKGSVKRVSEDFDWLNNTLLKLYPFLLLPQLEPVRRDIKDPYVRRKKDIQEYLQHLCSKKYLQSSYLFVDFLTISSEKIQKYKKSYDSMGFAKGVSIMKNYIGQVELDLSNRTRDLYYHSAKQFNRKTAQLHDTLAQALNKMIQSFRVAVSDTYVVVDLFAELHDTFGEMSNKFPTLKKEQYNDTLVSLNNLFLGIGDNLKNMTDIIQQHTTDYFRFYNGIDRNIVKLQRFVKDTETDYLEFKTNLQRKKQRVISDPSKWDIDSKQVDVKRLSKDQLMKFILPKEVNAENELKFWYAFNLKNYEGELCNYFRFLTKRYQIVFKNMSVELLCNDKGYIEAITKFISEGKKGIIGHAKLSASD